MATPHRAELLRLILQAQRDLVAQTQLRTLLAVAERTVAEDRRQLRALKARIRRARH